MGNAKKVVQLSHYENVLPEGVAIVAIHRSVL